jgi:hypothetical protein
VLQGCGFTRGRRASQAAGHNAESDRPAPPHVQLAVRVPGAGPRRRHRPPPPPPRPPARQRHDRPRALQERRGHVALLAALRGAHFF